MGPGLWRKCGVLLSDRCQEGATCTDTHCLGQADRTNGQSGALSLVLALLSIIRAPMGPSPHSQRTEVGWAIWNMPLKTSVSLHSHQIFTVLYYSGLAFWQRCIMRTSCGCHGNTRSYNNSIHRKIEKKYKKTCLLINNWKRLILDWSASQSPGTERGFGLKDSEIDSGNLILQKIEISYQCFCW